MRTFASREEFSANRLAVLDKAEAYLQPAVDESLAEWGSHGWYKALIARAEKLFEHEYREEAGGSTTRDARKMWLSVERDLTSTLKRTKKPDKHTPDTLVRYVATASINAATEAATADDEADLVLEWVSMHDKHVRPSHAKLDGQQRKLGEPFHVNGIEIRRPGDTSAPIEEWIGCRCVLRADEPHEAALVAAGGAPTGKPCVIVALPHPDDPVHGMGPEPSHVTLAYLGDGDSVDKEAVNREIGQVASKVKVPQLSDAVSGTGTLGPDKANVLLMDGHHLGGLRSELLDQPNIMAAHAAAEQHPHWIPHLTVGYPGQEQTAEHATAAPEQSWKLTKPAQVTFDRLALWHGDDQTEHPIGPGETVEPTEKPDEAAALVAAGGAQPIPWHGVLTTEGHKSGDRRSFKPGSLRTRNLPLPLTWQKVSDTGHRGSVKIARIDQLTRVPIDGGKNEIRAHGLMMPGDDNADKVIGEMAFFGRIGVSVDVDDATFEVAEAADGGMPSTEFTDARVSSACAVIIPAFQEAWLQLGEPPEGFMDGGTSTEEAAPDEAASVISAELAEQFARGPGWVTNPDATKRIHDYWTVPGQPGYEKIAWGTEGDYQRCVDEIGQERAESDPAATARFIHAQCAQWQHDAIGVWPGKGEKLAEEGEHTLDTNTASVNLVAASTRKYPVPKLARFSNPNFDRVTAPHYIEEDGVTYIAGHLAEWGQCHLDFPGICVTPPPLLDQGSNFMVGRVETDEGYIRAGCITLGGGHADITLGLVPAKAHYDDVTTAVADVCVGEDQFGLWMAGVVRPWATEEQRYQLLACDISGDWRDYGGEQALIAAHCVNSGGFRTKPQVRVVNGVQTALVAAGGVRREPFFFSDEGKVDLSGGGATTPNSDVISAAVAEGIRAYHEQSAAAAKISEVAQEVGATPADRLARVAQELEV